MNINLEKLQIKHASISWQWRNDPDVWKYTANKPTKYISENDEKNWVIEVLKRRNEARFAILIDNAYIGNTYLTNICNAEAEFHIFIGDKKYWGKGIGTKVLELVIQQARELKLKRLYLQVNRNNISACKLYSKNGFILFNEDGEFIYMERQL